MKAASLACTPSDMAWDGINWAGIQRQVRRLQTRIVKAVQAGRHNKAKALQWLLTHSCLDTPRKQGYGMLEVLQRAFAGNPIQPKVYPLNSHQIGELLDRCSSSD